MGGMGTGESAREHRERLRAHGKPLGAMTARPVRRSQDDEGGRALKTQPGRLSDLKAVSA